jgi:predicted CXXCH cytochrome family protein
MFRMSRLIQEGIAVSFAVSLSLIAVFQGLRQQSAAQAEKEKKADFVGTDVCLVCHIDFARKWARLAHSQKMLDNAIPKTSRGCEGCHGPGSEHVLGNRQQIIRWKTLSTAAANNICLQCHQGKVEAEQWRVSPHSSAGLRCDGCHEVHSPTQFTSMLRQEPNQVCLRCHARVEELAKQKAHHPLSLDLLSCVNCHNPHGSPNSKLLKEQKSKLCESCHGDDIPKPESHAAEDFLKTHGKQAKAEKKVCMSCHEEKEFCTVCHGGIPMPHPEDWTIEQHKKVATFKDDSPCRTCHEKEFCKKCHE